MMRGALLSFFLCCCTWCVVCTTQAAFLIGAGADPSAMNATAQTPEQLSPTSDRYFHFKARATSGPSRAIVRFQKEAG